MGLFNAVSWPKGVFHSIAHLDEVNEKDLSKYLPQNKTFSLKRSKEFALGRYAATLALEKAGCHASKQVGIGENGEPLWPDGFLGSIAHSGTYAIAVIAKSLTTSTLGIDIEAPTELKRGDGKSLNLKISKKICVPSEITWLNQDPDQDLRLRMIFSAKEALYKALFPEVRKYFGFDAAELSFNAHSSTFEATLLTHLSGKYPIGSKLQISVFQDQRWVISLVYI